MCDELAGRCRPCRPGAMGIPVRGSPAAIPAAGLGTASEGWPGRQCPPCGGGGLRRPRLLRGWRHPRSAPHDAAGRPSQTATSALQQGRRCRPHRLSPDGRWRPARAAPRPTAGRLGPAAGGCGAAAGRRASVFCPSALWCWRGATVAQLKRELKRAGRWDARQHRVGRGRGSVGFR